MFYLNVYFYGIDFGCIFRIGVFRWIGDVYVGRVVVIKVIFSSGVYVVIVIVVRFLDIC